MPNTMKINCINLPSHSLDDEVKLTKLFAPGLYTVQHIRSVDISTCVNCLSDYRTVKNAITLSKSLEKEARRNKKRSTPYKRSPSYDDVEIESE
ncbi:hypothetical protein INT48_007077 [Thamnidium elegans]|uniref:Uncharacterized protein n=1 Tax=Thamnidium elegans TaxID=101142 RepID=A0A8H7SIF2_9FUNG|nr:hypothetical protein INT48_007077 [Thamnidium elegans]